MNFKDVELLSAYLDGQLSPSDSARLESRLLTDRELVSALQALRESRGLLRQLPKRRAPRNFTLTPKMVGQKPPLPRSYPFLRFTTALATLLFVFSMAANQAVQLTAMSPRLNVGLGGGGGSDMAAGSAPATEAPMMELAPAATEVAETAAPTEAPDMAATELPAAQPTLMAKAPVASTATAEVIADQARVTSEGYTNGMGGSEPVPAPAAHFQVPSLWLAVLAGIALLGASLMFAQRRLAANKWRAK